MQNKRRSLKVLHVIPSVAPSRGGPSKAIIDMVKALRQAGVQAEIATTNDDGAATLDVPVGKLIQYHGAPVRFFKRFSPPLGSVREFAYSSSYTRWIKQNIDQYDVIHVHAIFSYCPSYTMYLARKKRIPYVVRTIGQLEDWALEQARSKKKLYLDLLEQKNIEGAHAVHFTADSEAIQARKHFRRINAKVIPLGIDLAADIAGAKLKAKERWGVSSTTPSIVYLSRLHPKKGLELLLDAAAQLDPKDKFQLIIAGDGDKNYKASLKSLVKYLGLTRRCHFIGFVDGVDKSILLQSADLFALTSYSENFGVAVLEAMSAGAPPLVTKEVALSGVIKKERLGYVCSLNEKSIKQKLRAALRKPDEGKEMGARAKQFVSQRYQWSNIAQELVEVYSNIRR